MHLEEAAAAETLCINGKEEEEEEEEALPPPLCILSLSSRTIWQAQARRSAPTLLFPNKDAHK